MSETTIPQKIYMVKFASNVNDDWTVWQYGPYKSEQSAIIKVYSTIIKHTYCLNDKAQKELENYMLSDSESTHNKKKGNTKKSKKYDVCVCPTTMEDLNKWCVSLCSNHYDYRGSDIFEGKHIRGWGWDISLVQIED